MAALVRPRGLAFYASLCFRSKSNTGHLMLIRQMNSTLSSPKEIYSDMVAKGKLKEDPSQREALELIQALHSAVAHYNPPAVQGKGRSSATSSSAVTSGFTWMSRLFGAGGGDTAGATTGASATYAGNAPQTSSLPASSPSPSSSLSSFFSSNSAAPRGERSYCRYPIFW
eukprot:CAMPEP_0184480316 /NCGR_PEP_ID=MMETSP0113_2-20130426/1804_1 /TAXON_ID=91329 /ORGANISM="Norrisiella sphaerica, Strain BC52" /LENGTH=169 /DNA_ID=CAMNT_0026858705 /DNA_START=24 /DNA_END=530 /DNA_ORIENTATION=-